MRVSSREEAEIRRLLASGDGEEVLEGLRRVEEGEDSELLAALTRGLVLDEEGALFLAPRSAISAIVQEEFRDVVALRLARRAGYLDGVERLTLSALHQLRDVEPLAGLTALRSLDLSRCFGMLDLSALSTLAALEELSLRELLYTQGVEPLEGLPALRSLDFSGCYSIYDPAPLWSLKGLTTLLLPQVRREVGPVDISGILGLPDLTALALHSNDWSGSAPDDVFGHGERWEKWIHFEPLAALTKLQSLTLFNVGKPPYVKALGALTELRALRMTDVDYLPPDLEALAGLTELEVEGSLDDGDIRKIAELPRLRSLTLSRCDYVGDLSPLAALKGLESLRLTWEIRNTQKELDFSFLAALPALRSLKLEEHVHTRDLSFLAALTGLESLDLSGSLPRRGRASDLSPLAALTELRSLDLSMGRIVDLSPLAALKKLRSLRLYGCEALPSLSPLAALPELSALDLSACRSLPDLAPLARLAPSLRSLDLSGCAESVDLSPLAALTALRSLTLFGDDPPDLSPLAALPLLDVGRVVAEEETLAALRALAAER